MCFDGTYWFVSFEAQIGLKVLEDFLVMATKKTVKEATKKVAKKKVAKKATKKKVAKKATRKKLLKKLLRKK